MKSCVAFAVGLIVCLETQPLRGQMVRGRVVQADSTPVADVLVTAVDSTGSTAANARTVASGKYTLRVLHPGRYELRVVRIGYRPIALTQIEVGKNDARVFDIVMEALPQVIPGVEVRDHDECRVSEQEGRTLLDLWKRGGATVAPPKQANSQGLLEAHLARMRGWVDATRYYAPDTVGSPIMELDSLRASESIVDSVIGKTPPETLETRGYVRRNSLGALVYDVPGPAALLSDGFLRVHCVHVLNPPPEHRDWIGLAFTPRGAREGVVDISGVLWLDRSSAAPRRVEFDYTNVPPQQYQLCQTEPPQAEASSCLEFDESGANRFGIGGEAEFLRLANGEWLTSRWTTRLISAEMHFQASRRQTRYLVPKENCSEKPKPGIPKAGDCISVLWPVPRLSVVSTTVVELWEDGTTVYRDSAALAPIRLTALKRAGGRPARLEGKLTDLDGRALRDATVSEDSLGRVARTNSEGEFEISLLPPGPAAFRIRCNGYISVRLSIQMLADSSRHLSGALRPDSLVPNRGTDCAKR